MPSTAETTLGNLEVHGTLPAALSGRHLQLAPNPTNAMMHSLILDAGRAVGFQTRSIATGAADRIITFGNVTFVFGDRGVTYVLDDLGTARRADLAGANRGMSTVPKVDRFTGELHLVAVDATAGQLHVTVSPGGHRRSVWPIEGAPERVTDLAVSYDHVVLLAGGFLGVASRAGDTDRVIWIATDSVAPQLATAYDDGDSIVAFTAGPALERLTLHPASRTSRREVLDATPQTFVGNDARYSSASVRHLSTVSESAAHAYDLSAGTRRDHDFGTERHPGALRFVVDPGREHADDGGWLVGFVRDETRDESDFVVLDAQAIDRPAIATVRIPRRLPRGLHGAWIPATK
ncbi:MAG: carotenoid oxygenase family protein [Acidimicrobiales bacterium]